MTKKIRNSSILVLFILCGIGMFTYFRTVKKELALFSVYDSKLQAFESIFSSFAYDYEEYSPRGKYQNSVLFLLTGICKSDQVIIGKENWLFFSSKSDGDPIGDYEGSNNYSNEDLDKAKNNILSTQEYLKMKDIEFCVFIPPNKENVYWRYMPAKYCHSKKSRTDMLLDYLSESGVNAINPKSELLKYSDIYKTYYKHDTHWNQLGAYIGVQCVMNSFDIETPLIDASIIQPEIKYNADLIGVANLNGAFRPDYGLTTCYTLSDLKSLSSTDDRELLHITNPNAKIDKTIFIIGDSFRTAMEPNLAFIFRNVYSVHRQNYSQEMLDEISPNYVILEFVERYSSHVINTGIY